MKDPLQKRVKLMGIFLLEFIKINGAHERSALHFILWQQLLALWVISVNQTEALLTNDLKMLVSKQVFTCCLLVALSYTSASDGEPTFNKDNIRATIPPTNPEVHTILIEISNYAETSNDVVVQADLPEYAKMTLFSMQFEEMSYMKTNSKFQDRHEVSQQTKDGSALNAKPRRSLYSNAGETAGNTVVKAKNTMTFELELKETSQNVVNSCPIDPNSADITLNLSGTTVESMIYRLYSPNYPEPYPNNADATWLLKVPEGYTVRFSLGDLDIEECCDRLTAYDGNSVNSGVLAVLTGKFDRNAVVQSTGNSLFLRLTSDCSVTGSGFRAVVESVEEIGVCSGYWYEVDCCPRTQWDGLYTLASGKEAFCSNGWAVFQRRMDGSITDFHTKTWEEYAQGFGDVSGEFWLGLRKLNQNTLRGGCRLRVDLQSFDYDSAYEEYSQFSVADESSLFRVTVGGFNGTAGDSLTLWGDSSQGGYINGMAFSTNERDNDLASANCAADNYSGGWWYKHCADATPNGLYGEIRTGGEATRWLTWKGNDAMKFIQMGVRCD